MRLLHLTGSAVDPLLDDVSRLYARGCLEAAAADPALADLEHLVAHVAPGGAWRFPTSLDEEALDAARPLGLADALAHLADVGVDAALPQMFCRPGMTTYRGLLDLAGVPYVGNRPETMALGADKPRASAVVAAAGVAVPASAVVRAGETVDLDRLPLPLVVKPADADNSTGLALVREVADLEAAVRAAAAESSDGRALVETYVELGREVRCGVVERPGGGLRCLPLEEYAVHPEHKPVRDRADKLRRDDDGALGLVAKDAEHAWVVDPADPVTAVVHEAALAAYAALGCRHHGLFDFRVDPAGVPHFLEASLYCSFAPTSVVVVMAGADGLPLTRLLRDQLALLDPDRSPAPRTPERQDP